MKRSFCLLLAVFTVSNSAWATQNLPQLDTHKLPWKRGGDLTLQFPNPVDAGISVSVEPGGAYIQSSVPKQSDEFFFASAKHLLRIRGNRLYLQSSQQPLAQFEAVIQTIAQWQQGLLIKTANAYWQLDLASGDLRKLADDSQRSTHLAVDGSLACSAAAKQVKRYDLQHGQLMLQGDFSQNADVRALAAYRGECIFLAGGHLYATGGERLTRLIDRAGISDFLFSNDRLFVLQPHQGISLYEQTQQGGWRWHSSFNKIGAAQMLSSQGDLLIAASGRGAIYFVDFANVDNPLFQADFASAYPIDQLFMVGADLWLENATGLHHLNYQQLAEPAITQIGINLGGSRRSTIAGDILYVADWFAGLHLYDISNPERPLLISSVHTPGSPKGVLVRDGFAFVADDDQGLQVVNVADPQRAHIVASLPLSGLAYTMKYRDGLLYLAAHHGGLHIIDVRTPTQPRLLSTLDTPGKTWAVALNGQFAYLADDAQGVLLVDIQDSNQPKVLGQYAAGLQAEDVIIRNGIAYVAFFDGQLHILNLHADGNFDVLSRLDLAGNLRGLDLVGDRLSVAAWDAGIYQLDVSQPQRPQILAQWDTWGSSWGVSATASHVYAMDWWGGVRVARVTTDGLRDVYAYQAGQQIVDIQLADGFAYAASGVHGLQVFDVSNGLNPVWATGVELGAKAARVAVEGNWAALTLEGGGLALVDIRDPFEAVLQQTLLQDTTIDQLFFSAGSLWAYSDSAEQLQQLTLKQGQWRRGKRQTIAVRQVFRTNAGLLLQKEDGDLYHWQKDRWVKQSSLAPLRDCRLLQEAGSVLVCAQGERDLRFLDGATLKSLWQHQYDQKILQMDGDADFVYVLTASNRFYQIPLKHPQQQIAVQASQHLSRFAQQGQWVLFAGEVLPSSYRKLEAVEVKIKDDKRVSLSIPASFPKGFYRLRIVSNGQSHVLNNAFEVGFVGGSKQKISMEKFQQMLKKQLQKQQDKP